MIYSVYILIALYDQWNCGEIKFDTTAVSIEIFMLGIFLAHLVAMFFLSLSILSPRFR